MLLRQRPNVTHQTHICVNDRRPRTGTTDDGIEAGELGVPFISKRRGARVEVGMVDREDGYVSFEEGGEEGDDVIGEGIVGIEE